MGIFAITRGALSAALLSHNCALIEIGHQANNCGLACIQEICELPLTQFSQCGKVKL